MMTIYLGVLAVVNIGKLLVVGAWLFAHKD